MGGETQGESRGDDPRSALALRLAHRVKRLGIVAAAMWPVAASGSGEEAPALDVEPPFDLLLRDLLLPVVSGPELAGEPATRWPGLKVILMSGYTEDEAIRKGISQGHVRFLQKPFDIPALAQEIRAALAES